MEHDEFYDALEEWDRQETRRRFWTGCLAGGCAGCLSGTLVLVVLVSIPIIFGVKQIMNLIG